MVVTALGSDGEFLSEPVSQGRSDVTSTKRYENINPKFRGWIPSLTSLPTSWHT